MPSGYGILEPMTAPKPEPEIEAQRNDVVEDLDELALREDDALVRIAEAVTAICGVDIAHVSLMEATQQCVVGHVGFETASFDRNETFCAHVIAEDEVVIVEDAEEDDRFCDNPFVTETPGVSFYVGLPVVIAGAPVGTLCALDENPQELLRWERSDLFGLVRALENHLEVVYHHGSQGIEHAVSSKFTAIRALATKERHREDEDVQLLESLRAIQAEVGVGFDLLKEMPNDREVTLAAAETLAIDER